MDSKFRINQYFLPVCGLLTLVSVTLQPEAAIRCGQMIVFMLLAAFTGKRIRLLPPALLLAGVVAANLLVPNGRVLFAAGRITVTAGALEAGLSKGALLIGLIYVSRISIGQGIRLPGVFGGLLFRSFGYFEALTEGWKAAGGEEAGGRKKVRLKEIIPRLDRLLLNIDGSDSPDKKPAVSGNTATRSVFIGALMIAFGWIPLAVVLLVQGAR